MTTIKLEVEEDLLACRICLETDSKLIGIYEDRLAEAFAELMDIAVIRGSITNTSILELVSLRVPLPSNQQLRPRRRPLFVVPAARTRALAHSPLHRALKLINDTLDYDSQLDIFHTSESRLYSSASRYIESIVTPSADDGLPQRLCAACARRVRGAAGLRARARRARAVLERAREHHHYITTDYIRSIDRVSLRLTADADLSPPPQPPHHFLDVSHDSLPNCPDSDIDTTDVKDTTYIDMPADMDDIEELDVKLSEIKAKLESKIKKEKKRKVKKEKGKRRKVKEEKPGVEWVAKKKTSYERKKKGFKRYFMCDEDYAKFEERYNIEVVRLSEEEQQKEMEARKESENYLHALVRCEKCYKGFLSMFTYENHIKVHDPAIGPNECHFCLCRFKWPNKLRTHLIECHQLKYVCKECKLVIRGRYMAVMHAQFHAGKTWECKHCPLTFKKQSTFYTHLRINHSTENALGGTCDICGETFTGAMGLRMHKTQTHNKKEIKALKCMICKVQFENKDALDRHFLPNNDCDPKMRFCETCGCSFLDEDRLSLHRQHSHGVEVYKCDDCNKSFLSKSSLSTHIDRVHLNIKPRFRFYNYKKNARLKQGLKLDYMCETCGKAYTCFALLKTHQMSHTGERPFKCTQCPKTFITASQLKGHRDSFHARIRKYRCPQCPKTFLRQSSIYKHRLIHTGEKPYECTICSKAFTQSGSLTTHVKYVHMKLKPPPRRRNKLDKGY